MKRFLALYIGSEAGLERSGWHALSDDERELRSERAIQAWMDWADLHAAAIVDMGAPLGRTKRVSSDGVVLTKNALTGYVIVQAESHQAAAKLFENHPHFSIFPGEAVEILECLPLPGKAD
jgi:hypothetical protein